jgi:hypothetical protein
MVLHAIIVASEVLHDVVHQEMEREGTRLCYMLIEILQSKGKFLTSGARLVPLRAQQGRLWGCGGG